MRSERELNAIVAAEMDDARLIDEGYATRSLPTDAAAAFEACLRRAEAAAQARRRLDMLKRAGLC